MEGINTNGVYDTVGLINSIIVDLDKIEVKGVTNMKIVFDSIAKLNLLSENIQKILEEKQNGNSENRQGKNV